MNEIAQFRERAAKREREKMRDVREAMPSIIASTAGATAPAGPKVREWGKPQPQSTPDAGGARGFGQGPQGYGKPVGFVRAEEGSQTPGSDRQTSVRPGKTDEELEQERKEIEGAGGSRSSCWSSFGRVLTLAMTDGVHLAVERRM